MMDQEGAFKLLAHIAIFDNRNYDENTAKAWATVLPDIRLADAKKAVDMFFASETEYLKPGHIRTLVEQIRAARLARYPIPAPPSVEIADDIARYKEHLLEWRKRIADGEFDGLDPEAYSEMIEGGGTLAIEAPKNRKADVDKLVAELVAKTKARFDERRTENTKRIAAEREERERQLTALTATIEGDGGDAD